MRPTISALRVLVVIAAAMLLFLPAPNIARAQVVTEQEIQDGFFALSILAAGALTPQEESYIRAEIAGRSRMEPEAIKQEMKDLGAVVQIMRKLGTGLEMMAFRQALLATIFQDAMVNEKSQRQAAVQVLYHRLIPVVWNVEEGTFFALTDAQVLVWLNGGDPFDEQQVYAVALQVYNGYRDLSYEDRLALGSMHFAHASGVFDQLAVAPQDSTPQQPAPEPEGGQQTAEGGGGGMEPWALEIMNDVMNDMHITTLNIIENMSSDGGYWEWEPTW